MQPKTDLKTLVWTFKALRELEDQPPMGVRAGTRVVNVGAM